MSLLHVSFALVSSTGLLLSCATQRATTSPPNFAASESSIAAASQLGAAREPQAAEHLQLARDQLKMAKGLVAAGDDVGADLMLQRARADAELAFALTLEDAARAEAMHIQKQVRAMGQ